MQILVMVLLLGLQWRYSRLSTCKMLTSREEDTAFEKLKKNCFTELLK
jgi:hypothetical protein